MSEYVVVGAGTVVSAVGDPSRNTSYPVTATLSVEADQLNAIDVELVAFAVRLAGVLGGRVSGVVTVAVLLVSETLPAASSAITWY